MIFNLVVLGINWGVASEAARGCHTGQNDLILGLKQMYEDNDVAKYYDDSLIGTYHSRYSLFTLVLTVLGAISIVVPLIARNMN